jgi:hypothetical protein
LAQIQMGNSWRISIDEEKKTAASDYSDSWQLQIQPNSFSDWRLLRRARWQFASRSRI